MNRPWKIGIVFDTKKIYLGGHDTHLAFRGLPNAEVVALADSNTEKLEERMAAIRAKRHYTDFIEMFDREKFSPPALPLIITHRFGQQRNAASTFSAKNR